MRLMEVLLHGGSQLGGWRTAQIQEAILAAFGLSPQAYTLTQLRYDLRKMKGHGLLERVGKQLLLPAHRQRNPRGGHVRPLPQAHLRSVGQLAVSSSARDQPPSPLPKSKPPITKPMPPSKT